MQEKRSLALYLFILICLLIIPENIQAQSEPVGGLALNTNIWFNINEVYVMRRPVSNQQMLEFIHDDWDVVANWHLFVQNNDWGFGSLMGSATKEELSDALTNQLMVSGNEEKAYSYRALQGFFADAYCRSRNARLASKAELDELKSQEDVTFGFPEWTSTPLNNELDEIEEDLLKYIIYFHNAEHQDVFRSANGGDSWEGGMFFYVPGLNSDQNGAVGLSFRCARDIVSDS